MIPLIEGSRAGAPGKGAASQSSSRPRQKSLPDGASLFVEDADQSADHARIIWGTSVDPNVVTVTAAPALPDEPGAFDLHDFGSAASVVSGIDCELVMIRGLTGCLRFDVVAGTMLGGPVLLAHRLTRESDIQLKSDALRQLALLCEQGSAAPWTLPVDPRIDRLILALRTMDALGEGASLREIALGLSPRRVDWPGDGESAKSWVRRLVASAKRLKREGPRGLLKGTI